MGDLLLVELSGDLFRVETLKAMWLKMEGFIWLHRFHIFM